jgi:hypothetical protein
MTFKILKTLPAFKPSVYGVSGIGETADADVLWSGKLAPPEVGSQVVMTMNRIGVINVTGYAVDSGWLGVMGWPVSPPKWWIEANGQPGPNNTSLTFGCEIAGN